MCQSEQVNEIAAALAEAQAELTNPTRDREVTVQTRAGGKYRFRYATLANVLDGVRPVLAKHGVAIIQPIEADSNGKIAVRLTLVHKSGQWIGASLPLLVADGASNQERGSAITYARRYLLTTMLPIAADEDDDANHADGNTVKAQQDRAPVPVADLPYAEVEQDAKWPFVPADSNGELATLRTALATKWRDIKAAGKLELLKQALANTALAQEFPPGPVAATCPPETYRAFCRAAIETYTNTLRQS